MEDHREPRDRLAAAPLAIGVALGLASVIWSALFFGGVHSRGLLIALDVLAWAVLLVIGLFCARGVRASATTPPVDTGANRLLTALAVLLLIATAAVAVSSFVAASAVYPHGEWDAWAQWNLRARFFFRGMADGSWREAFAPILAWSHADYPPLVPISIARLWTYAGRETVLAPIAFAGITAAATVLTAGLAAGRLRGAARGCLAASVILACPSFVRYAASQCADIALGFFMLAAFRRLVVVAARQRTWLVLAGIAAALAAWTKNEGVAFFVLFVAIVAAGAALVGRLDRAARSRARLRRRRAYTLDGPGVQADAGAAELFHGGAVAGAGRGELLQRVAGAAHRIVDGAGALVRGSDDGRGDSVSVRVRGACAACARPLRPPPGPPRRRWWRCSPSMRWRTW